MPPYAPSLLIRSGHALTVAEDRRAGVAGLAMPVRLVIAAEGYGNLADLDAV